MLQTIHKRLKQIVFILVSIFILTIFHILSFYSHNVLGDISETYPRIRWGRPSDVSHVSQNKCVVVFGAAVWPGYFGPVASDALADRTLSAVELYKKGFTNCIILSGADSIYGAHEVDIMTDLLLGQGVPEEIIELDRDGVNTRATIENLDKERSYILLSNDFHLARIGLLAQRAGLGEKGFTLHAATYQSGGRYRREWFFVFREAVAWWYYFFVTII